MNLWFMWRILSIPGCPEAFQMRAYLFLWIDYTMGSALLIFEIYCTTLFSTWKFLYALPPVARRVQKHLFLIIVKQNI